LFDAADFGCRRGRKLKLNRARRHAAAGHAHGRFVNGKHGFDAVGLQVEALL